LIDPKTFSSNSVRFFNQKIYDQCLKKETCAVYEKIKVDYEVRRLGILEARMLGDYEVIRQKGLEA